MLLSALRHHLSIWWHSQSCCCAISIEWPNDDGTMQMHSYWFVCILHVVRRHYSVCRHFCNASEMRFGKFEMRKRKTQRQHTNRFMWWVRHINLSKPTNKQQFICRLRARVLKVTTCTAISCTDCVGNCDFLADGITRFPGSAILIQPWVKCVKLE